MKFLLCLGLLSVWVLHSQANPPCHTQELCDCTHIAIDWLHSLPKRQIPVTEADVEVMADALDKTVKCALAYRDNCTTPLQKEVIGLLAEGALDFHKDFMSPGSRHRANYLAHAECINKVSQMDVVKEEMEYALSVLEKMQSVSMSNRISYACCGISKVSNAFIKLGRDNCGQEAVDAAAEILNMVVAQLPEVLCSGYDAEGDTCKAVLPPAGSKPSNEAKELKIYEGIRDLLKNWLD